MAFKCKRVFFPLSETLEWKVSKWSRCDRSCRRTRQVWCSTGLPISVPDEMCIASTRPDNVSLCSCPRRCLPQTSWSPWSECSTDCCIGKQTRIRRMTGPCPSPSIQERVCTGTQCPEESLYPLAQALSYSFKPHLYAGPWSECQPVRRSRREADEKKGKKPSVHGESKSPHRRKHKLKPTHPPQRRSDKSDQGLPWRPKLPADLEVSLVESSLASPFHGSQRRDVTCRGQNGEVLPFR